MPVQVSLGKLWKFALGGTETTTLTGSSMIGQSDCFKIVHHCSDPVSRSPTVRLGPPIQKLIDIYTSRSQGSPPKRVCGVRSREVAQIHTLVSFWSTILPAYPSCHPREAGLQKRGRHLRTLFPGLQLNPVIRDTHLLQVERIQGDHRRPCALHL